MGPQPPDFTRNKFSSRSYICIAPIWRLPSDRNRATLRERTHAMEADLENLKSILKKPSSSANNARELATQHAQILQHRKDLEAQILDSLILLSTYPLATKDPAQPSRQDAKDFKSHVRLFQPSDYDDLIEERNTNNLCGYTLCSKPRRRTGPGGEWTLNKSSGGIVKRKDVESWCSQGCKRRALYVKVQLNETAAWERAGIPDIEIELFEEDRSAETAEEKATREMEKLRLEDDRQAARDTAMLAMERGETSSLKPGAQTAVPVRLKEKSVDPTTVPATGVFEDEGDDDHLKVEGYRSKTGKKETQPTT